MERILSEIVVAVVTGIFSSWLANRWFRSQRRWERKEDSYREVLEALHKMSAENDEELTAAMQHRDLPEARLEELSLQWREGKAVVYKYADLGSVAISPRVEKILGKLRSRLENDPQADSLFEELDNNGHQVRIALDAIKAAALAERWHLPLGWFYIPRWIRRKKSNSASAPP